MEGWRVGVWVDVQMSVCLHMHANSLCHYTLASY